MSTQSRLLPWFALLFFALLTLLAGMMLTSQKSGSSLEGSSNLPTLNLNDLFGVR